MANMHQRVSASPPKEQQNGATQKKPSPIKVPYGNSGSETTSGNGMLSQQQRPGKLRRLRKGNSPRKRRRTIRKYINRLILFSTKTPAGGLMAIGSVTLFIWVWRLFLLQSLGKGTTSEPIHLDTGGAGDSSSRFLLESTDAPTCAELASADEVSYTLVTQMSADRMWMMEHHCSRFANENPMSIAVWTNQTYDQTIKELIEMGCVSSSEEDATLSEFLKVEVLDASDMPYNDYPVNRLRNLALQQVSTTHIIYIDVDFWTSEEMYEVLDMEHIRQALWDDPKLGLVIPAFQLLRQCKEWVDCREKNLPYMPYSPGQLADMFHNERGTVFDPTNRGGHGTTKYKAWTKQHLGELLEIDCLLSNRYEPFVVIRYCKESMAPFQSVFSGYGKNKMTWMMQNIRQGTVLSQVGGIFLVHYPHLDSSSRQKWNEAPSKLQMGDQADGNYAIRRPKGSDGFLGLSDFKRGQNDQLFLDFRSWMEKTIADDQRRLQLCEHAQDDDTKLWIDKGKDDEAKEGLMQEKHQQESSSRDIRVAGAGTNAKESTADDDEGRTVDSGDISTSSDNGD